MTTRALPILTAGALALAAPAAAEPTHSITSKIPSGPAPMLYQPHHKPFAKMTLRELEKHQRGALARYSYVSRFYLRWWKQNRPRLLQAGVPSSVHALTLPRCPATGIREPRNYCWYATAARWTARQLAVTRGKIAAAEAAASDLSAWECIHSYEGSWTDGGGPYYGGLQMDLSFQATYGPELLRAKGTADNWTPQEQIMVARRARDSGRGYYPWPNTARACGLI